MTAAQSLRRDGRDAAAVVVCEAKGSAIALPTSAVDAFPPRSRVLGPPSRRSASMPSITAIFVAEMIQHHGGRPDLAGSQAVFAGRTTWEPSFS